MFVFNKRDLKIFRDAKTVWATSCFPLKKPLSSTLFTSTKKTIKDKY